MTEAGNVFVRRLEFEPSRDELSHQPRHQARFQASAVGVPGVREGTETLDTNVPSTCHDQSRERPLLENDQRSCFEFDHRPQH